MNHICEHSTTANWQLACSFELFQGTINATAKILSKDKDLYLGHIKPSVLVNYKLKRDNKNKAVDFYKQDLQRSEIFLTFLCLFVVFYSGWMAHLPWHIFCFYVFFSPVLPSCLVSSEQQVTSFPVLHIQDCTTI